MPVSPPLNGQFDLFIKLTGESVSFKKRGKRGLINWPANGLL